MRYYLIIVLIFICAEVKAQKISFMALRHNPQLPWSISGWDRSSDGRIVMVSDVDYHVYKFDVSYRDSVQTVKVDFTNRRSYPVRHAGANSRSGFEAIRVINDSTFLISDEQDIANDQRKRSHSNIYLAKLRSDSVHLHKINYDKNFPDTLSYNSGVEGVSLSYDKKHLWIMNERPAPVDVSLSSMRFVRLTELDLNGHVTRQFLYPLHQDDRYTEGGVSDNNGVTEMLVKDDDELIFIERAFNPTKCTTYVKIFSAQIEEKKNVLISEHPQAKQKMFLTKKLLADANALAASYKIDNYEGMTFGPQFQGKQTLLLISDNNGDWNKRKDACGQQTDVLVLSIE